jgi:C4-dicarboxylate transporter DctM subunit
MAAAATLGSVLLGETDIFMKAAQTTYSALNSFVLLAVPLYILAGTLLQQTGLSDRLFSFAASITAGLRGGLGVATVVACAVFAAISGSSVATAATIGLVALPILEKNGYARHRSGALIAGGGTLGILIPPSIGLLLYGVLTDQSIGALFVAGLLPGLAVAIIMAIYVVMTNPRDSEAKPFSLADLTQTGIKALPVLALPIMIFVGIYGGFATATEVAALAVAYIILVGLALRKLGLKELFKAGTMATHASVMILMLVAFGALLTHFLTVTRVPQIVTELIANSGIGFFGVVSLMILIFVVLGMFLESLSMMLIMVPILFPVAYTAGIPPIAFGIFVVLAVEVAQITPPVGINLFTVAQIGKIRFEKLVHSIVPYVIILILMMYTVAYVPQLATWLPSTMEYR